MFWEGFRTPPNSSHWLIFNFFCRRPEPTTPASTGFMLLWLQLHFLFTKPVCPADAKALKGAHIQKEKSSVFHPDNSQSSHPPLKVPQEESAIWHRSWVSYDSIIFNNLRKGAADFLHSINARKWLLTEIDEKRAAFNEEVLWKCMYL